MHLIVNLQMIYLVTHVSPASRRPAYTRFAVISVMGSIKCYALYRNCTPIDPGRERLKRPLN